MCVAWEYFEQQAIKKGFAKGVKEGFKEGFKEGRIETWEKIVNGALKINIDYDMIKKITGLPLKKIKEIAVSAKA